MLSLSHIAFLASLFTLLQFTAVTTNAARKVQAPIFRIFLVLFSIYGFAAIVFLCLSPWCRVGGSRIKTV